MNHDRYTYRVMWSDEDQECVGLCAEFPSLSWLAPDQLAAFRGIRKVVADVLADLKKNGDAAPEPLGVKRYSGKFQVRIPAELHRQLAMEAAEEGVSLNRLVSSRLARIMTPGFPRQKPRCLPTTRS